MCEFVWSLCVYAYACLNILVYETFEIFALEIYMTDWNKSKIKENL